jgi:hypothetical protein
VTLGPFAIGIRACDIASGVAIDDTVNVGHWDYLKDIAFEQLN